MALPDFYKPAPRFAGGRGGIRFTFEVFGQKQVDRMIGAVLENGTDFKKAFRELGKDFYREEEKQFDTQGKRTGKKWKKLSKNYAKWKKAHYPGRLILERTGALKRSLTNKRSTGAIYSVQPLSFVIGTKVSYGIYHQLGTPTGLPARPPIRLTDKQKDRWMKILHAHLVAYGRLGERVVV